MNPMMSEKRTVWDQNTLVERRYGDIINTRADKNGKIKRKFEDPVVNLFGQWSIIGAMCDMHLPTGTKQNDVNEKAKIPLSTRAAAFGVYGRAGATDAVPSWNITPHPCFGYDENYPHGGYNEELCKVWR